MQRDGRVVADLLAQHLVARPEGLDDALVHHEQQVAFRDRRRAVRHDDDDAAVGLDLADRVHQRLAALAVEVRVRLVEHHERRVAVERAGERDALALAAGEPRRRRP